MGLKPLVDMDISLYKSCWAGKGDYISTVESCEDFLDWILGLFPGNPSLFLSGKNNFRYSIYPDYKANRKDKVKPIQLGNIRDYLIDHRSAIVVDGMEADDAIGIAQAEDTIIVSGDKDLLQIPGNHFDIKNNQVFQVTEEDARFSFYKQLLMGDAADNVDGLTGIGDVKSTKLITGKSKQEMKETVQEKYKSEFGDNWFEFYDRNARLLYILRKEGSQYYDYF
jgi:5'-3' exonuclease